jgi:hypothetical protein
MNWTFVILVILTFAHIKPSSADGAHGHHHHHDHAHAHEDVSQRSNSVVIPEVPDEDYDVIDTAPDHAHAHAHDQPNAAADTKISPKDSHWLMFTHSFPSGGQSRVDFASPSASSKSAAPATLAEQSHVSFSFSPTGVEVLFKLNHGK